MTSNITEIRRLSPHPAHSSIALLRTVEVVWSTGAEVRRTDTWTGEPYHEVLSLEPGHVDPSRMASGAPLLDSHAARRLAGIVGVVERAWIEAGAAGPEDRAVIHFSSRAEVTPVWEDVRSGIIRHVSVGYRVRSFHIEEDAGPPVWRAVDWQPVELSLVAVAADPNAGLRSAGMRRADRPPQPCRLIRRHDPPPTEAPGHDRDHHPRRTHRHRRPGERTRDHRDRRQYQRRRGHRRRHPGKSA